MNLLNKTDIEEVYQKYVLVNKNAEYARRYSRLPRNHNNKEWKWEGKDFPRVIALLEFARMVDYYDLRSNNLLTFNGLSDPELGYLKYSKHHNFDYLDDPKRFDLHTLDIPNHEYDFAMANQTLEHVYNPFVCIENICNYLKKGAYIYANVPTVNIAHSTPFHFYTGFTPVGLCCMFEACGFKTIEVGQWGNKKWRLYT